MLVEGPDHSERGVDGAGWDAVVGDVEDAARARGGPDERGGVRAREGEVDGRDGEVPGRRGHWRGGCQEQWRHCGDAGLNQAADAASGLVERLQRGLLVAVVGGGHYPLLLKVIGPPSSGVVAASSR